LQIDDVHFCLIIGLSLGRLEELIVWFVVIGDKMVQFAIMRVQSLQDRCILFVFNVELFEWVLIELGIVDIEFIFFYLHVDELQHFLGEGAKLIELNLLPV
jgi:hypothetical protein